MRRVLDPLERMGARVIEAADGGRLPLTLQGAADPVPIVYESPVPSAQLKSAVLLAGLVRAGRDHGDRGGGHAAITPNGCMKHFGAKLTSKPYGEHGRRITLQGQPELEPANVVVPADPSSAAFPMVAALLVPGSDLILDAVMTNPLRTGLLTTLREMGANIEAVATRDDGGEEVADLRVRRFEAERRRCAGRARAGDDRRISDPGGGRLVRRRHHAHARLEGIARQGIRPAGSHRRHAARQWRRRSRSKATT